MCYSNIINARHFYLYFYFLPSMRLITLVKMSMTMHHMSQMYPMSHTNQS